MHEQPWHLGVIEPGNQIYRKNTVLADGRTLWTIGTNLRAELSKTKIDIFYNTLDEEHQESLVATAEHEEPSVLGNDTLAGKIVYEASKAYTLRVEECVIVLRSGSLGKDISLKDLIELSVCHSIRGHRILLRPERGGVNIKIYADDEANRVERFKVFQEVKHYLSTQAAADYPELYKIWRPRANIIQTVEPQPRSARTILNQTSTYYMLQQQNQRVTGYSPSGGATDINKTINKLH